MAGRRLGIAAERTLEKMPLIVVWDATAFVIWLLTLTQQHTVARRGLQDSRGNARARRLKPCPEFPAMKAGPRVVLPLLGLCPG